MNTLTQQDVRAIMDGLTKIKELTDLLRRSHLDVPFSTVYWATEAELTIRCLILERSLGSLEVEEVL